MTHRECFFKIVNGEYPDRAYFCPDITSWYVGNHRAPGEPQKFGCGVLIPEDDPIRHANQDHLDPEFRDLSLMDFYKKYDWGMHCHIYHWYDTTYSDGVSMETKVEGREKTITYTTPIGTLSRRYLLAADGSWAPIDHLMKSTDDFPILLAIIRATHYTLRDDLIREVLDHLGDQGEADVAVSRSPFGKLIHEYLGFQETVFMMEDEPELFDEYYKVQAAKDMEVFEMAAQSSIKLVILSDHADATLYSPNMYRDYCLPFYQMASDRLHKAGKYMSTHVDGNLKSLMTLMPQTGIDMLDGCTPAPMFDYEVEYMAEVIDGKCTAFCGVPSSLFCDGTSLEDMCALADRILRAFHGRVALNVGDVLPPNGDIRKMIALGEYVKNHPINQELKARAEAAK